MSAPWAGASVERLHRSSMKICQRLILCNCKMLSLYQGSSANFPRTSSSSRALTMSMAPPSSTKGPPIRINPSATRVSINVACSSQNGWRRVSRERSRWGPASETTINVWLPCSLPAGSGVFTCLSSLSYLLSLCRLSHLAMRFRRSLYIRKTTARHDKAHGQRVGPWRKQHTLSPRRRIKSRRGDSRPVEQLLDPD